MSKNKTVRAAEMCQWLVRVASMMSIPYSACSSRQLVIVNGFNGFVSCVLTQNKLYSKFFFFSFFFVVAINSSVFVSHWLGRGVGVYRQHPSLPHLSLGLHQSSWGGTEAPSYPRENEDEEEDDAEGWGPKPGLFVRWQKLSKTTIAITHSPSLSDYTDHRETALVCVGVSERMWRVFGRAAGGGAAFLGMWAEMDELYSLLWSSTHLTSSQRTRSQWFWLYSGDRPVLLLLRLNLFQMYWIVY